MTTREQITQIETKIGGPVLASRAIGVSYETWFRWREGKGNMSSMAVKAVELLHEKLFPDGARLAAGNE